MLQQISWHKTFEQAKVFFPLNAPLQSIRTTQKLCVVFYADYLTFMRFYVYVCIVWIWARVSLACQNHSLLFVLVLRLISLKSPWWLLYRPQIWSASSTPPFTVCHSWQPSVFHLRPTSLARSFQYRVCVCVGGGYSYLLTIPW